MDHSVGRFHLREGHDHPQTVRPCRARHRRRRTQLRAASSVFTDGRPGEVKLIMPCLEDRIAGRFVYHCHILEHEDGGMMANLNVQPRR
jgi:FtsP/CotA-like multicopper oxidase with cupredoxin domain